MEVKDQNLVGGSLQISTDVIAKIARLAALEVDGVREVKACPYSMKSLLGRLATPKPVEVTLQDEVAEITVNVTIAYGARIPALSEKVQQNVKASVQNMTSITVSRVNVVITGVGVEMPDGEE
ncbi:Asp23/Gls24 family envelope stress response protein [Gemmiger sp. An120]|uniref:Asp23/Gls24 family envelope stress response protein n=1 Tax=Gemmiger sp. An120 TaxID=1965549 RepID=UPI000B3A9A17|nr:Asp23/Gls24 family envelope stress response protein [Gemmiger sp. An120]OUQ44007.1 Asp23/Gls24 family envelope stress response protein [Gemmiger sp. An120]HIX33356.1 Asp23/Gls24 family envelope stress response protein [Candidatus Gemmiger avium]